MSLGPSGAAQDLKETPIQRVKMFGNALFSGVIEKPAERLFYFGLALLLVGLPFGVSFPLAYYGVLALLGAILVCQFALAERNKKKDHDK